MAQSAAAAGQLHNSGPGPPPAARPTRVLPSPPSLSEELAEELGYGVSDSRRSAPTEWQEHISEVAATTGLSGREGLFELAAKTYAAKRSLQGSLDGGGDELPLVDILAAAAADAQGVPAVAAAAAAAAAASSNGAVPAPAAANGSRNGGSKAGNGKAKASKAAAPPTQAPAPAAAPAGRGGRSFRSEIDGW